MVQIRPHTPLPNVHLQLDAQCPQRNFHRPANLVFRLMRLAGGRYRCECGCEFTFHSEFEWQIIADGAHAPPRQS